MTLPPTLTLPPLGEGRVGGKINYCVCIGKRFATIPKKSGNLQESVCLFFKALKMIS
jgi:hypothetical protein